MAQQQQGIALNQAAQGGLPEGNMEILDAAFCEWDYNGSIDHYILALGVQFQDENNKTFDQYFSAGELTYFVPSDDGSMAVPVADKSMLSDSTNAWKFLSSLMEVGGEPMVELLGRGNVKELVGMKVTVQPFAQPKRQGLIRGGKEPEKDKQVLLVTAILAWPGQAAPAPQTQHTQAPAKSGLAGAGKPVQGRATGKPTAGGAGQKAGLGAGAKSQPAAGAKATTGKPNGQAGASTTAVEGNLELAAEAIQAILIENDGVVTKKDLAKLAFTKASQLVSDKKLAANEKTGFVQLLFKDEFLHGLAQAGTIVFDGSKVSFPG